MKPLYLVFVVAILFTSCSDWKYSNGTKLKQSDYRSPDQAVSASPEKVKAEVISNVLKEEAEETATLQTVENVSAEVEKEKIEIVENPAFASSEISRLEKEDDSIAQQQEIIDQALKAEKNGKKSMIFGIIGLALIFVPFFVGLVFSIIALTKGIKSLNQRYNTPKGLRYAKIGVILSSIALALSLLALLAVILIVLFL